MYKTVYFYYRLEMMKSWFIDQFSINQPKCTDTLQREKKMYENVKLVAVQNEWLLEDRQVPTTTRVLDGRQVPTMTRVLDDRQVPTMIRVLDGRQVPMMTRVLDKTGSYDDLSTWQDRFLRWPEYLTRQVPTMTRVHDNRQVPMVTWVLDKTGSYDDPSTWRQTGSYDEL